MRFLVSGGSSGSGLRAGGEASEPVGGTTPVSGPAVLNGAIALNGATGDTGGRGPWLGWAGRALLLLFPAGEPAPRRPGWARARVVALTAGLIVAGACVSLLRQGGTPAWRTVYAEDGSLFLPRAVQSPWPALVHEYAGYLQLVPQVIADAVARLPLRDAAAAFALAGAALIASVAVFVFHASQGQVRNPWLRALLGCSVVLLAPALLEIANTGVNSPWYLMYALFWALLWRPRSRAGMAVAALVAFGAMSSNVLNLLYLPLAAARVLALPRVREHAVTFGWLAGIGFQVIGLMQSRQPSHLGPVPSGFHFYGQHVLVPVVFGWKLAQHVQTEIGVSACIALAGLVVAAVVVWAAWPGGPRGWAFAATAVIMSALLSILPSLIRTWVAPAASLSDWFPGSRYTASAILLIEAVAIAGVDAFLRRRATSPSTAGAASAGRPVRPGPSLWAGRIAVVLLVVGLSVGWATSFRYLNVRSGDAPWSQTYPSYARHFLQGGSR